MLLSTKCGIICKKTSPNKVPQAKAIILSTKVLLIISTICSLLLELDLEEDENILIKKTRIRKVGKLGKEIKSILKLTFT
jgi:hypothetical protein